MKDNSIRFLIAGIVTLFALAGCATGPKNVAPPAAAAPMPAPMTLSLDADANFDFDESTLKPAGRASLDQLVSDMRQVDVSSISIVGHTDSIGSEAYNQALSERRAASAANYLVQQGVNPNLITATGRGETQPIASNDTAEGRARNRRVDIAVDATRTPG
jgi:OOP family OmpA-OmpF porin